MNPSKVKRCVQLRPQKNRVREGALGGGLAGDQPRNSRSDRLGAAFGDYETNVPKKGPYVPKQSCKLNKAFWRTMHLVQKTKDEFSMRTNMKVAVLNAFSKQDAHQHREVQTTV